MNTGQTQISNYSKALRLFWGKVYREGGQTIYSLQQFGPNKPEWINVEHIFPMAWVVKGLIKRNKCRDRRDCRKKSKSFNLIESDLHNLYPSRRDLNMIRGSYRFGSIKGEIHLFGGYNFKVNNRTRQIEPAPASQGEVARSMFYMADAYDLKLYRKQAETLAYWNKIDQPSKEEKRRNDLIEDLQGTRNYFIDESKAIETLLNEKHFNK